MTESDIRIGNTDDAINLIDELLKDIDMVLSPMPSFLRLPYKEKLEARLKALKDALKRGII